jgi:hypothetical protein
MISRVEPCAIQAGQTAELTVSGQHNFGGATAVLFEGNGLAGKVVGSEAPAAPAAGRGRRRGGSSVSIQVSAEANAALGPRELRVVAPDGVSSVGLLVVVPQPVVAEADDKANDAPAQAQPITLPAAIAGSIGKTEDVDWYALNAKAGQRVTLSVWGNRLQNKIHNLQMHLDPIIQIHDAQGRELAANDNYDFADPMLSYEFKETGTYLIQIRDTAYGGNRDWTYVLQATSGPYATAVFPMAVNPGSTAALHASGYNFDTKQTIPLEVPKNAQPGPLSLPLPTAQGPTLPFPVVVTELPLAVEDGDTAAEGDKAQSLSLPVAMSGRLGAANDVDAYRFEAKKEARYAFEVIARRAGAATDPVLRILDAKGKTLTEADDTFGKDPRLEWRAPEDGAFLVQIGDLHSRGGDLFGYVLLAEPAKPDFVLTCDPDKANMGPGARTPIFVRVERRGGFDGPVAMRLGGLPAGMIANALVIPAKMTQGVIVFAAAPDAPKGGSLITLEGTADTPDGPLVRTSTPRQEIYLPGGGRGLFNVQTIAAAVTEPSDITVEATPTEITLKPGSTATIDVTITRNTNYTQGVNLAVALSHLGRVFASSLPDGVSMREAGSKTLLGPKETKGKIILEAKPDAAPIERVPITVMGHVSIDFVVKTAYSSAPIWVTVSPK